MSGCLESVVNQPAPSLYSGNLLVASDMPTLCSLANLGSTFPHMRIGREDGTARPEMNPSLKLDA